MSTNSPFLIGAIRSQERGLLAADEYTRLTNAPSLKEAVHVLAETPYGVWIKDELTLASAYHALDARLAEAKAWLLEQLQSDSTKFFIASREQALVKPAQPWDTRGQRFVEQLTKAAKTPLQKKLAQLTVDQLRFDTAIRRTDTDVLDLVKELHEAGYTRFTEKSVAAIRAHQDAMLYEKLWDEELMQLLRPHAIDVTGDDAVLAYWQVLELEVKQIRLFLAAKQMGVDSEQLEVFTRSRFRQRV